ncbi:hypothetical protein EAI_03391 [Harpegnathos saltator]|uniref:Uncharacterized protein n=1 Tax=Harpegnathos saltator TaxID=610380 RepID=E2BJZ7_HARSA|nr:hypothetical protein EAI_03391 [Harpegnathos saltator]
MANNDMDDILTRLDEIKKLQAELRHLVPRIASNSSGQAKPQDLTSDASASIRFPSLLTFPEVSNVAPSSSKHGRVQKSAAHLNLNNKLLPSNNRPSTAHSKSTWRLTKSGSAARETDAFKAPPRSTNDVVAKSRARNSTGSNVSTIAANSARTVTSYLTKSNTANRVAKHLQGSAIRREPSNDTVSASDKTSLTSVEKSNVASRNKNNSNAKFTPRQHMISWGRLMDVLRTKKRPRTFLRRTLDVLWTSVMLLEHILCR